MSSEQLAQALLDWIREKSAGAKGLVVGLSGGIDSAVVAGLIKRVNPESSLGVIMPCYSDALDEEHARLVAAAFDLEVKKVDLGPTFDLLLSTIDRDLEVSKGDLATANVKSRLRMVTLYFYANRLNYMVVGTGNKSELVAGYFTKHGDSGVDILPLADLVKDEVRELARYLGVPDVVIDKAPSGGLWLGQTDEEELGVTYAQLDEYILTGMTDLEAMNRIQSLEKNSEHKRRMPAIAYKNDIYKNS